MPKSSATLTIRNVPLRVVRNLSGVAIYDTLFVELADREGVAVVSFDDKVLKAYPKLAKRPRVLH